MRNLVYAMIVLLAFVHQDFWWWDRIDPLVFGFIPIGLAYQAGISILAATLWALAVKHCWPKGLEDAAGDPTSPTGGDA